MRMANDRDQAIVRAAVSDAAAGLLAFVPSLGTREVFAFGEGVALPTRLKFRELPRHLIPRSESLGRDRMDGDRPVDTEFIAAVVQRWRGAMMSQRLVPEKDHSDLDSVASEEFARVHQSLFVNPEQADAALKRTALSPDAFAFPTQPAAGQPLRGAKK
jgi:hypothetical protein